MAKQASKMAVTDKLHKVASTESMARRATLMPQRAVKLTYSGKMNLQLRRQRQAKAVQPTKFILAERL
jgi:hypothetical protein